MIPLFDTHAHYNDRRFDADAGEIEGGRDSLLAALLADNVKAIVNAGTNLASTAE